MRRPSFLLPLLFTVLSSSACSSNAAQKELVGCEPDKRGGYKHFVVTLTEERLKRTPSWEKQNDNPPLSARSALKIAGDFRKTLAKDQPEWRWRLTSLSLRHSTAAAPLRKWYWVAFYEQLPTKGGIGGGIPYLFIVVLMDGTIVKPVVKISDEPAEPPYLTIPAAESHADGKTFMATAAADDLGATSEWKVDAENPPLSARRAISLATTMRRTLVNDFKDHNWELVALDLVPNAYSNRWLWGATFWVYKRPDERADESADLILFVRMDGVVDRPLVTLDRGPR